ncbi:hypothetical protein X975_20238, partial [Stegodyphus mimosarum]
MDGNFLCLECSKSYTFRRNLRAHIIKSHPSKLEELAPTLRTAGKFPCNDCEKIFSKQHFLRAHERTEHGKSYICNMKRKCPLCDFSSTKAELMKHFENSHNVCIITENLQFPSFQEFIVWKKDIETKRKCTFSVERGVQKTKLNTKHFFVCHRSGNYTPQGNGLRHLKLQGSKKINGFCPASITVTETDRKCYVHYLKTHVGHKNETGHTFLSEDDKMYLGSKIGAVKRLRKGKLCSKLENLKKRHELTLTESCSITEIERGWQVLASDSSEIYMVEQNANNCTCQLICSDCNACIHKYTCTCIDASIKWNMCKHIHFVCQYRKNKKSDSDNDSTGEFLYIDNEDDRLTEQDIINKKANSDNNSTGYFLSIDHKDDRLTDQDIVNKNTNSDNDLTGDFLSVDHEDGKLTQQSIINKKSNNDSADDLLSVNHEDDRLTQRDISHEDNRLTKQDIMNKKSDSANDSTGDFLSIDHKANRLTKQDIINKKSTSDNDSTGDFLSIDHEADRLIKQDSISPELEKSVPNISKTPTLMEKIRNLKENFLFMMDSVKTDAEYCAVKRLFDTMQPTLDAVRIQKGSFSEPQTTFPSNKIIASQDKTKKKRKIDVSQICSTKTEEMKETQQNVCTPSEEAIQIAVLALLSVGKLCYNSDTGSESQQHTMEY